MWCSLCCWILFVSCVLALFVVLWCCECVGCCVDFCLICDACVCCMLEVCLRIECVFRRVYVGYWCLLCTQMLLSVRWFVLFVVCWYLCPMLVVTIWWKPIRVWVLLWVCMLRVMFPFVSPIMLLMWELWVSVLSCVLLLLCFRCVCCMWV